MTERNELTDDENASMLADIIDRLMEQGSGHVNIIADTDDAEITVNTVNSTDCSGINGACCQPTEQGLDDEDDE